jgi:hypothetical protein
LGAPFYLCRFFPQATLLDKKASKYIKEEIAQSCYLKMIAYIIKKALYLRANTLNEKLK